MMTRLLILFMLVALPQSYSRIVYNDGACSEWHSSGHTRMDKLMLSFCDIYGRPPRDKKELLRFHKGFRKQYGKKIYPEDGYQTDRELSQILRNNRNTIKASGDTCFFYYAKTGITLQILCQVTDEELFNYSLFREGIRYPMAFDKDGEYMWSKSCMETPWREKLKPRYNYYVAFSTSLKRGADCRSHPDDVLVKPPLMVLVTYDRDDGMKVDLTLFNSQKLYYGKLDSINIKQSVNLPTLEKSRVLDSSYFEELKVYLNDVLRENPAVKTLKTFEMVLFGENNSGAAALVE